MPTAPISSLAHLITAVRLRACRAGRRRICRRERQPASLRRCQWDDRQQCRLGRRPIDDNAFQWQRCWTGGSRRVEDLQPVGNVLATRVLDGLGTFSRAPPRWATADTWPSTDANAIFMAADGNTVNKVVSTPLDFVTPLNNGNVLGHAVSSDLWHLFGPARQHPRHASPRQPGDVLRRAPTGKRLCVDRRRLRRQWGR